MLNARQRAVIAALLPPGGPASLPGAFDSGFEEFHDRFETTALPEMRLGFKAALFVGSWVAPILIGRLPPLSRLSAEDGARALEALGKSHFYLIRQMLLLLKAIVSFHYGARPKTRDAIGFPK